MRHRPELRLLAAVAAAAALAAQAQDGGYTLRIAVATSVEDSGLMEKLRESYQHECRCTIESLAAGSAQALEMLRRKDVDAAITHAPDLERKLLADNKAKSRFEFMANDFILVGPGEDPASAGNLDLADAFAAVAQAQAEFVSRSDGSGTHRAEIRIWREAGLEHEGFRDWYQRAGAGQARALLLADELGAYALADSATFAAVSSRRPLRIKPLAQSSGRAANRYSIVTSADESGQLRRFASWLQSQDAQRTISRHRIDGRSLFVAPAP